VDAKVIGRVEACERKELWIGSGEDRLVY
jgi:hypothetical protein